MWQPLAVGYHSERGFGDDFHLPPDEGDDGDDDSYDMDSDSD